MPQYQGVKEVHEAHSNSSGRIVDLSNLGPWPSASICRQRNDKDPPFGKEQLHFTFSNF